MVNRAGEDRDVELSLPCIFANSTFADLYHGHFMDGAICNEDDGLSWFARVSIEAGGIGSEKRGTKTGGRPGLPILA